MNVCFRLFVSVCVMVTLTVIATAEDKSKTISDELRPFVESKSLAGAVLLVANKDKVLTTEAIGHADIANKKPMRNDSLFWIASMSKPITGTGLMILVDEGKVKLDDPITKYLPDFADLTVAPEKGKEKDGTKKAKSIPTVKQCLTHTSGMAFKSAKEAPTLDGLTLADAVASYTKTPLLTEPGTKWSYSNAGINVAGRIIEVVSKTPYEKFMEERLFAPLGMKDTTFFPNEKQVARLAKSYRPNKAKDNLEEFTTNALTYPLTEPKRYPMPAGGLFSTAEDLAQFNRMILNGGELNGKRYLSEKAVKQMTTNQSDDPKKSFGLGWDTGAKEGSPYGHGGAHATHMRIDPQSGLVLVYMVQHSGYGGTDGAKIMPAFFEAAKKKYAK